MTQSIGIIGFALILVLSGWREPPLPLPSPSSMKVQSVLASIPEKDRDLLNSFFRFLLSDDPFAYTLYGKKPMSMAVYFSHVWSLYHPGPSLILEKGSEVWKKYALKFPSDEFALKFFKDNRGVSNILLINKTNMLNVIHKNLGIFKEILGPDMDPNQLVYDISFGEEDFMKILKNDSALLGILLGFGNVNSKCFERKVVICEGINSKMTPPFSFVEDLISLKPESKHLVDCYREKSFSSALERLAPSKGYSNLGEELNEILLRQEFFEVYGSDYLLDQYLSPVFAMDRDDPETKALQEEYLETKKKIIQAYSKGDFLEVTLNQWMNPS